MNLLTGLTTRSLALAGGLLATSAALVAETITNDPAVGAGSFLLGGAGLIAAISAFTKDYWTDRQKQREHELMLLRIRQRNCRTCVAVHELHTWARAAHAAVPTLPLVPDLHVDADHEVDPKLENLNA